MSDIDKKDQDQPSQDQSDYQKTLEEIVQEKILEAEEKFKKEIAGLNRRNSDLEKQLQEKELAHLDEVDRKKREAEIASAELEKIQRETNELRRSRFIEKSLIDAGLGLKFANRINGETEEEIQADIERFSSDFNGFAQELHQKEMNKALGGKQPEASTGSVKGTMTRAEWNKLPDYRQREVVISGIKIID
jgi:hypothetical protein